jgi:hypothetical protein
MVEGESGMRGSSAGALVDEGPRVWEEYGKDPASAQIAVFGGKPCTLEERRKGLHCGVKTWPKRWEFLHDVSVVEVSRVKAPIANRDVALIKRAIWQVESEVELDGNAVAEDLSKLHIGISDHKLFIAGKPRQEERLQAWLSFLSTISHGIDNLYLALVPSYSQGGPDWQHWREGTAEIQLYLCPSDRSSPVPLGDAITRKEFM